MHKTTILIKLENCINIKTTKLTTNLSYTILSQLPKTEMQNRSSDSNIYGMKEILLRIHLHFKNCPDRGKMVVGSGVV